MGTMKPTVEGPKDWLVVEDERGELHAQPVELFGHEAASKLVVDCAESRKLADERECEWGGMPVMSPYLPETIVSAKLKRNAYCAYFSMPGHLDRTDNLGPYKTAIEALTDLYLDYPDNFPTPVEFVICYEDGHWESAIEWVDDLCPDEPDVFEQAIQWWAKERGSMNAYRKMAYVHAVGVGVEFDDVAAALESLVL